MEKEFSIENKCICCGDTKIINKGTSVEEKCPICCEDDGTSE
jgi:hypothetical protein